MRLTSTLMNREHHITIPNHTPLKTGTLSRILKDVAAYVEIDYSALVQKLFS